jgi:hypothetical protein
MVVYKKVEESVNELIGALGTVENKVIKIALVIYHMARNIGSTRK